MLLSERPPSFVAKCEHGEPGLKRGLQTRIYSLRNALRLWQDSSHNNRVSKRRALKSSCPHTSSETHLCTDTQMQIYPHVAFLYHTHRDCCVCAVGSSCYVVFSLTSVSNQCSGATTAQCIINSGTRWRLGFWGRERHRPLQKMIEGCSLLINTIPELMEHIKLLTWLFLSLLHLAQS